MTKVLITVKTYPHPSINHKELVCTAGITESFDWVRLYPVDFRYLPENKKFKKYQWIDVKLSINENDKRKESRCPNLDTLKLIEKPLDTSNNWRARRDIIDNVPVYTLNELLNLYDEENASLGIVKPTEVLDIEVTEVKRSWKPKWQMLFDQLSLFDKPQKPLEKIPYKFQYVFKCQDSKNPHKAMITDWELGTLYRREVQQKGSEKAAVESVKNKYLNQMCSPKNDFKFFMGTVFPYNTWIVLGVFYPQKDNNQLLLFQ